MNYREELHGVVETVVSSPKLSAGVSAATASLGVASATDVISGLLSTLAMLAGIVATALICRVHWAAYKNHLIQNKIFRQQLRELGGDPDADE